MEKINDKYTFKRNKAILQSNYEILNEQLILMGYDLDAMYNKLQAMGFNRSQRGLWHYVVHNVLGYSYEDILLFFDISPYETKEEIKIFEKNIKNFKKRRERLTYCLLYDNILSSR